MALDAAGTQQQLYVHLPGLPISSRNGGTATTTTCIAALTRLEAVDESLNTYSAGYNLPINIKYSEPTLVNQIQVEIRNSRNELATLVGTSTLQLDFT